MYICYNSCKGGVRNVSSNFQKSGSGIRAHRGILQGSRNKETKDSRDIKFWKQRKVTSGEPQRYRRTSEKSGPDELGKRTYGSFDGHPTRERVYRARQCSTE